MSKVTDLTAITTPDNADLMMVIDVSDTSMDATGTNKKITVANAKAFFGINILPATGTVDDSNTSFTFTEKPTEIIINGSSYIENGGWTWSILTATLDFPVGSGGKIYGRK